MVRSLNRFDWDTPLTLEELNIRVTEAEEYLNSFVEAAELNQENQPKFNVGTMSYHLAMALQQIRRKAMTNKMPVVGQKYLSTETGWECKLIFWDERAAIAENKYGTKLQCIGKKFWDYFEELPDSNSRETEEAQIGKIYKHLENGADYRLAGIDSGNHAICIKLDEKGTPVVPTVNEIPTVDKFWQIFAKNDKSNKTTNPVDFEKKKVNEVERALKELKEILEEIRWQ